MFKLKASEAATHCWGCRAWWREFCHLCFHRGAAGTNRKTVNQSTDHPPASPMSQDPWGTFSGDRRPRSRAQRTQTLMIRGAFAAVGWRNESAWTKQNKLQLRWTLISRRVQLQQQQGLIKNWKGAWENSSKALRRVACWCYSEIWLRIHQKHKHNCFVVCFSFHFSQTSEK